MHWPLPIPCAAKKRPNDFYYTYGLFRLAGIVQQIYYRYFRGQSQDKHLAQFTHMNKLLEHMALAVTGESRLYLDRGTIRHLRTGGH
ncbi:hypothetical protein D9M69_318420 [compost metagenome]|nr:MULTISPECIES: hypothetical protein [unclassified Pseudomonas]